MGAQSILSHQTLQFSAALPNLRNYHFPLFRKAPSPRIKRNTIISCRGSSTFSAPAPEVEPEGRGAAAPTRGDKFLERQQAKSAAELALKKEARKVKRKSDAGTKISTSVTCCYGCGSPLQATEADAPGYVDPQVYELVNPAFHFEVVGGS